MVDSSEIQHFIDRFKLVGATRREQEASHLATGLLAAQSGLETAKRLRFEQEKLASPNFNIFKILQVARKESAHSNFLAELLKPSGTHGQGTLFLREFLEHFIRNKTRKSQTKDNIASWANKITVSREATIFNGRCDLLINAPNRFLIIIENKIDAVESETQLVRYKEWLDRQPEPSYNRFLIFLTKRGVSARSLPNGDYIRLSYQEDVPQWLANCLPEILAPTVRMTVEKYIELLKTWRATVDAETDVETEN